MRDLRELVTVCEKGKTCKGKPLATGNGKAVLQERIILLRESGDLPV